jgi:hypothetical protein
MQEQLIRDHIADKERLRDRVTDADRFGRIESSVAVLLTRFEAALQRAVSGDDLKELRREMEDNVKHLVSDLRLYVRESNEQQSKALLSEFDGRLAAQREAQSIDQRNLRRQVVFLLSGAIASIIGALVVFWLTRA